MSTELNPPELAEKISAKGFTHAAGFRIIKVEPGSALSKDQLALFQQFYEQVKQR